ncbi:PrsW family intramembrane metalloprotease [Tepidibacter formicigenes]|uniref:Protease PrsW n=1 Tax=Tepidibacter formicigenes DSM 15518 TaxID=1123349 RepID=A0A1M6N5L7_9FIRM|nr:PrsW family glutamic-type intramembrane protease [Tepidibacter formicigenes]SHJ90980.1 Membrane proteinase PrsW, cleaves anti-sigma factor RsiW, M82 family [Tepidibacter formicigenes DSM 15518]
MDLKLLLIAIAPGLALAFGIYLTDRYDKEPVDLLLKVFILGCLSVIPTIVVEKFLSRFNVFSGIMWPLYTAFLVAGFTEEYFKRFVVLKSAFKSHHFNEKLDGIVYCTFSSLGFATVENVMYVVFRFASNPYIGIGRGILSVPAHMLFGVTMGYYLSLAKYCVQEESKCKEFLRKSLIVPVILHGIFDFILIANMPILMVLFIPYVLYLWKINLDKLNEYTKNSRDTFGRINNKRREEF